MARRKRKLFVAVVEDDQGMRAAIRNLLSSNGFQTRGFCSAEQFLKSRDVSHAVCLVLDLRLPGLSGLELQRELRATGHNLPAIFATGEPDSGGQLKARLLRAGAMAVLHKPFNSEELLRLVQIAFDAHVVR
jgi:FixJ family two-component response regulator